MACTARASAIAIAILLMLGRAARADSEPAAAPLPEASPPADGAKPEGAIVPAGDIGEVATPTRRIDFGVRLVPIRWITVPSWMLNLFTAKNVPLSSWGTGLGVYGRRGNFSLMFSFNYMDMSPPDGNWLGKGASYAPETDTDLVQFRGLSLWAADLSFIWNNMFTDWFGMHLGAGIGVGLVRGHILRTSDGNGPTPNGSTSVCNASTAGDVSQCHPVLVDCPNGVCNEMQLAATSALPGTDTAATPRRFTETSVPPALPIVNVVVGIDFRLPQTKGWEATIEGGFYDAFFLGLAVGYTF
jgi:opacity protein-like surface antigen